MQISLGSRVHGKTRSGALLAAVLLVLSALCNGGVVFASPSAQDGVSVSLTPAMIELAAGSRFEVNVTISGVKDLSAFQLDILYDPALVQVDAATIGDFIGSTGRDVVPLGPRIDAAAGLVKAGAFSQGTAKGADGGGILVKLNATAMRAGAGQIELKNVLLTDTQAKPITAGATGAEVVFSGEAVVPTGTPIPATPTFTPAPPTPTATLTPIVTPPTAAPAATGTPTAKPTATATFGPVETQRAKVAAATVQAWSTERAQWTATPSATVTPTATATATATATPQATATPAPSPTVEPAATPAPSATRSRGAHTDAAACGRGRQQQ